MSDEINFAGLFYLHDRDRAWRDAQGHETAEPVVIEGEAVEVEVDELGDPVWLDAADYARLAREQADREYWASKHAAESEADDNRFFIKLIIGIVLLAVILFGLMITLPKPW